MKFISHVSVAVPAVAPILIKESLKVFFIHTGCCYVMHVAHLPDTACLVINHNKTAIHVDRILQTLLTGKAAVAGAAPATMLVNTV